MTLWVCQSCTASYSVGASRCPQCGSDNYLEEGQEMAKANAASGTTYYVAEGAPVPDELHPDVRLVGPGAPAATEEGEQPSDGNSSSTSTEQPQTSGEPSSPSPRKPAPTTEPSSKKSTASGTAASTATSGRETDAGETRQA